MSVTKTARQKFCLRSKLVVPFVLQIVAAAGLYHVSKIVQHSLTPPSPSAVLRGEQEYCCILFENWY